jgi:hypothetical protein
MGGKMHVTVGGPLFFYTGSGLELKHMEKGKTVLPRDDFARLRGVLAAVVNDPDGKIGSWTQRVIGLRDPPIEGDSRRSKRW